MRAFKLGGKAAKLGSVVAVVVGLSMASSGTAGASTDANYAFATTQSGLALTWGFPDSPFHFSFGSRAAVNVSFRVNGQAYAQGGFRIPAERGPSVTDPSTAYASSSHCQGCLTNAIAITVDVLSGPVSSVYAPTKAVATDNYCVGCNTLAADYTFVVAPGTVAALTPAELSILSAIASQVQTDANTVEPSQVLANQVVSALDAIQAVLESTADQSPENSPQSAAVPELQPQAATAVQEFGQIQYSTAQTG